MLFEPLQGADRDSSGGVKCAMRAACALLDGDAGSALRRKWPLPARDIRDPDVGLPIFKREEELAPSDGKVRTDGRAQRVSEANQQPARGGLPAESPSSSRQRCLAGRRPDRSATEPGAAYQVHGATPMPRRQALAIRPAPMGLWTRSQSRRCVRWPVLVARGTDSSGFSLICAEDDAIMPDI